MLTEDQKTLRRARIYDRVNNFHKRPLHGAQIKVSQDYFVENKKVIQSQWARNSGKTENILFIATLAACTNENFWVMIVCPQIKQGKKIYWHKKRLQRYPPPEFVTDINSTDMKMEFDTDSLITVEGCENYENLRGAKPNLVLYDEFQLHSEEFHLEVMQPNLIEKASTLMVFGTPPKQRSAYYVEFRDLHLKDIKAGDTEKSYYEFDSTVNPVNDLQALAKRKAELINSGNKVIWEREYEGKLVFGGEDAVYPKWDSSVHMMPHDILTSYLEGDRSKLKWFTICDPGSTTCFGVLFIAYNPYTQQIFILDEIYEKERARMDAQQIWKKIEKKWEELYPNYPAKTWKVIYDEAAAWFQREIQANFRYPMIKSDKAHNDPETDVSRIKMAMAQEGCFNVSKRCYWLQWEIESFMTDEDGEFPTINDHLHDGLRYFFQRSGWKLVEKASGLIPFNNKRTNEIEPSEWADNIVESSLEIDDVYTEYFN